MSRSCRADELIAAKLNSWNGEEVKRTRPSPAFRSLTLPPHRLCSHPTSIEKRCLCRSEHFWVCSIKLLTGREGGEKAGERAPLGNGAVRSKDADIFRS